MCVCVCAGGGGGFTCNCNWGERSRSFVGVEGTQCEMITLRKRLLNHEQWDNYSDEMHSCQPSDGLSDLK